MMATMTAAIAQPVAPPARHTFEDWVATLADKDGPRYEWVDGQLVEQEPRDMLTAWVATQIAFKLKLAADERGLGHTTVENALDLRPTLGRGRKPDVTYHVLASLPRGIPATGPIREVPDLAVEVVSVNDRYIEVVDKAHEYLRAGVRLVWLVVPERRRVYVYRADGSTALLTAEAGHTIDAGDVIPGFAVPVAEFFPAPTPETDADRHP